MAEAFKAAAWAKKVCELLPKGSGLGCRPPGSQVKWIYCVHKIDEKFGLFCLQK